MKDHSARSSGELPRWIWLVLPLGILLPLFGSKIAGERVYERWISSEHGLVENLTVFYLAVAVVAGVLVWRRRGDLPGRWTGRWVLLLTVGCFYFLGEEASWGQHWFGWETPEGYAELNKQDETNLHNLAAPDWLLDLLPRNLLSLLAVVGGILVPLRFRGARRWPASDPKDWLWPTMACLPAAVLASTIRLPERIIGLAGGELPRLLDYKPGELEEYALAAFLMIYLLSIRARLPEPAEKS